MSTESFMDQIKAFGARLGLPKVDVDKLVDIQLKNIDALGVPLKPQGTAPRLLRTSSARLWRRRLRKRQPWCATFIR
jgi:hypothetical protein